MQLFYFPDIQEGLNDLPEVEARHAVQVLRKRVGDELQLIDGRGGWYSGEIVAAGKKHCQVTATLEKQETQRAAWKLTLAVSPTKQNERFEWFLEKATEIGVDRIVPLACKRTERSKVRLDRFKKVLVSAMKQSLQAWLPKLDPLTTLEQFLNDPNLPAERYIGWCDDVVDQPLVGDSSTGQDVCIMIGPEGDFTAEEVDLAGQHGFQAATFGQNRLRTETAGIVAAQMIATINQMK